MSQATTVKEVLIAAKWILENHGWCQGYYRKNAEGQDIYTLDGAVCFCSIGAIMAVETAVETTDRLAEKATKLLDKASGSNVVFWNDMPGRTKKQVLKVFDQAIKEAT